MIRTRISIAFTAVFLMLAGLTAGDALAQRRRTGPPGDPPSQAADLPSIARDLGDKAQDAYNLVFNQRRQAPVEVYVALAGFAGSTAAYSQMAADGRDENGLRNVANKLVGAARDIDTLLAAGFTYEIGQAWSAVQQQVVRLSDRYNFGYRPTIRPPYVTGWPQDNRNVPAPPGSSAPPSVGFPGSSGTSASPPTTGYSSGRFLWRGRVDGTDYILLQGSSVTVRHIENNPITEASYDLAVPLPQTTVQPRLRKLRGRGTVEIVRQPAAANGWTLTVLIEDLSGGSDFYEFEVVW